MQLLCRLYVWGSALRVEKVKEFRYRINALRGGGLVHVDSP
jgi:hypothetical protein